MVEDEKAPAEEMGSVIAKTAKVLGVDTVLVEAYRDLLQPSFRELGQEGLLLLAKAVTRALSPMKALLWGFDEVTAWLQFELMRRLSRTPPEVIAPPRPHIAGPALLHLMFLHDEANLRELFASLLAAEIDTRSRAGVHPAYLAVLQQMSADEARVVRSLSLSDKPWYLSDSNKNGRQTSPDLETLFAQFCLDAGVQDRDSTDAYLDNLLRLRVLVCDLHSTTEFAARNSYQYQEGGEELIEGTVRELYVSAFGKGLLRVLSYDHSEAAPSHVSSGSKE